MSYILKSIFLIAFVFVIVLGCSDDTEESEPTEPEVENPVAEEGTIWSGSNFTFTKGNDTDPAVVSNQDQLTSNVILTRGTDGGQIFNIAVESSSNKSDSPVGTEWALGRTDDIAGLTFAPFRTTVGQPKDVVGMDLVLHLIKDDIFLNVNFN